MVEARDRGDPPQASTAAVTLTVTDTNLHAPAFRNSNFQKSVSEDVKPGYLGKWDFFSI